MKPPGRNQRRHTFAAGLEFDGLLRHQDPRARLRPLPEASNNARAVVRQAGALLGVSMSAALREARTLPCETPWQAFEAIAAALERGGVAWVHIVLGASGVTSARAQGADRWALVTGVELEGSCRARRGAVRALLVLDPSQPRVWGCGHNARLVDDRAPTLTYRSLEGGRWDAGLVEAFVAAETTNPPSGDRPA